MKVARHKRVLSYDSIPVQFRNRQNLSMVIEVRKDYPGEGGFRLGGDIRKPSGVLEMFSISICLLVAWVCSLCENSSCTRGISALYCPSVFSLFLKEKE